MVTLLASLLLIAMPVEGEGDPSAIDCLQVDPLLIEQAAEVWRLLGSDENPVWPGWNARGTPLLFYLPNQQDVLINHPSPPEGFRAYRGPLQFPGGEILVRDGKTLIEWDGQNTSREISQVQTLVVADTLSNRMQNVKSLIQDPRPAPEKLESLTYQQIGNDPISTLGLIAHEAFHVFQHAQSTGKSGNELDLMQYPTLSVANNVGFALEADFLAAALQAVDKSEMRQAALKWLAVRRDRRRDLTARAIAYEDGTEFSEGLAKYVEYRLTQVLEDVEPSEGMWRVQGFRGYSDLSYKRTELIEQMQKMLGGEVNVNNDPYGASPVRMRLYYSGMAIAALLDRLSHRWHSEILQPDTTLTGLLETSLGAAPDELAAAAESLTKGERYEQLVRTKTELQQKGEVFVRQMLADIQEGPHTTLVIDYSAVEDASLAMSFTPFGILPVDEHRGIFRLVPVSARIGSGSRVQQTRPAPLLRDDEHKQVSFQLSKRISQAELLSALGLESLPTTPIRIDQLELPGAKLELNSATVSWQEARIEIRVAK